MAEGIALSYIIDLMSPSPAPNNVDETISGNPSLVHPPEMTHIRRRIVEMGLAGPEKLDSSPRERELAEMILRLTSRPAPDLLQLTRQAEIISGLIGQRNFLIRQAEERRALWELEKDGWARTAEALISQRNRVGDAAVKDEELERQCANLESDNKALREKLADTQSRLTSLETELTKLRPLLLMQPFALAPSHSSSLPYSLTAFSNTAQPNTSRTKPQRARKKKEKPLPPPSMFEEEEMSEDEPDQVADDHPGSPKKDLNYYKRPATPGTAQPSTRKGRQKGTGKVAPHIPLMADARPEHLLLAARKIGRERAGIMAGLVSAEVKEREREKEREKERQQERKHAEGIKSPKTPKRAAQLQYVQTPPHALNPGYVFLNNPVAVSFPGSPVRGASSADQHHPHQYQHQVLVPMHHVVHTPTRGEASGTTVDIPTPLDSLVSAARSMMDDGGKSKATNGRARRASTIDVPDSPVPPKRRKVAGPNTSSATLDQSMPESRVRSALDVLADQAAVFSSKGRELSEGSESRRGSVDSSVSINGKGAERTKRVRKASEKAKMALGKLKAADGKKGKGKAKVKTKAAAKGKGKGKTVVVEEEKLEKLEKLDNGKGGDSDVDVDVESEEGDRSSRGRRKEVLPPKLRHEGLRKDSFQFVGKWTARQPSLRPVTRWGEGSPTPVARRRNRELNMDVPASPPANVAEGTGEQMVGGNDGGENDNERVQKTQLDPESSIPMPTSRSRSVLPSPRLDELPLEQEGEAQHTAAPLASYELTLTTPWASLPDTLNLPHTSMALVAAPTNKDNNATQISPPALPLDSSTPPYIHPTTSSRGEDRTEIPLTVADTAASIPPGAPVADADADGEMDADGEVDLDADGDLDDMSEGNSHLVGIGAPEVGSASDTTHSFDHYASGSWEVTGYSKGDGAESAFDPDIMLRGQEIQMVAAGKRPRSPYVKWSKEEDDLLAQAVAKYGQKWDLVQRTLPSRGYHQVRQRWLRKLGVFDSKPDLSIYQMSNFSLPMASGSNLGTSDVPQVDPPPNPKLGLAPLSSELAFSGLTRASGSGAGPGR